MTPTQIAANYRSVIADATDESLFLARAWYSEAQAVAHNVADNLSVTLEVGASIVAAFSPRVRWSQNVRQAIAFSNGEFVPGLSNNRRMAQNALTLGFDALKGPKTNAFARAIAGDLDAVVIDVWMMQAGGLDRSKAPTVRQYRDSVEAVKIIAEEIGESPAVAQALIWIMVRGAAA